MERPNPDALLAQLQADESHRGKLKIFFGMCPGVGKTYAMLQEARQRQTEGFRVLIGVVMTHGRPETQALLEGLELIPLKKISYRGITLEEMDIDEILKRRPQLVLVDELAHTNAPGSRHPKRYQDVLEILAADIDVFTTLNVQHVDSRREDILAVTRVSVGETVPDTILDEASEITLVDISPQSLHQRLAEGKVYVPDQAQAATANFFKTENLTALREMALRLTTAHVNRNLRSLMLAKGLSGPSKSGERILVAIGASPYSESLVRLTRRWAGMLDASWIALYVEGSSPLAEDQKERLMKNLTLARALGAEILHAVGDDVAQVIVDCAHKENVTQIIVGKTTERNWQRWLGPMTTAEKVVNLSGQIDVHMVRLSGATKVSYPKPKELFKPREYGVSFLFFAGATLVNFFLEKLTGYQVLGLLYLLTVVLSGAMLGRSAALMLATLSALAWDYLFIPPRYTFHLRTGYDLGLVGMFFITALMMGLITSRLRRQKEIEQKEHRRSEALYELTRALALSPDITQAMRLACDQINGLLHSNSSVLMVNENDQPVFSNPLGDTIVMTENQKGLVLWTVANRKAAGRFSDTLPEQELMYLPLMSSGHVRAVLVIRLLDAKSLELAQRTLLESFTALMTVMLEKDQLLKISREAKMKEETQNLQSALLDNLSHELKTPVTIISGYMDALILFHQWPKEAMDLLQECRQACIRLTGSVDAVLDLTKLDVGNLRPNFVWAEVKDIIAQALKQEVSEADEKRIHIDCPPGPLYVNVDLYMIIQSLRNIVQNAIIHGPEGKDIDITVRIIDQTIRISVIDQGEGIPKETLAKIFDKFYRGAQTRRGGLGLGLSIARRFVQLNEGDIEAENLSPKGFMVTMTLPMVEK